MSSCVAAMSFPGSMLARCGWGAATHPHMLGVLALAGGAICQSTGAVDAPLWAKPDSRSATTRALAAGAGCAANHKAGDSRALDGAGRAQGARGEVLQFLPGGGLEMVFHVLPSGKGVLQWFTDGWPEGRQGPKLLQVACTILEQVCVLQCKGEEEWLNKCVCWRRAGEVRVMHLTRATALCAVYK